MRAGFVIHFAQQRSRLNDHLALVWINFHAVHLAQVDDDAIIYKASAAVSPGFDAEGQFTGMRGYCFDRGDHIRYTGYSNDRFGPFCDLPIPHLTT